MMSNDYITLAQAAQHCPGRPAAVVVWRWCRKGLKAANGERVFLKHIKTGQIYTTQQWVDEFVEAKANADMEYFKADAIKKPTKPLLTYRQRQISLAKTAQRLREQGMHVNSRFEVNA